MSNTQKENNDNEVKHLTEFFRIVRINIKKHGMREINKKLKEMDMDEDRSVYNMFNLIVDFTCAEFNTERKELLGKVVRGNIHIARIISVELTLHYTNIKVAALAINYDRTRQILHKWLKDAKLYSQDNKFDQKNYFIPMAKIKTKIDELLIN